MILSNRIFLVLNIEFLSLPTPQHVKECFEADFWLCFAPFNIFCILLKAFVLPIIDNCVCIWLVQTPKEIQIIQNKINDCIYLAIDCKKFLKQKFKGKRKCKIFENELLEHVNIVSIEERLQYYINVFVYDSLKYDKGINFIKNLFSLQPTGRTRASNRCTLLCN